MNPGIYFDLSMADYLRDPALSKSAVDKFHKCPLDYVDYRSNLIFDYQTEAMRFGSLLHGLVLEKRTDWVAKPETYPPDDKPWNANANYCKEWAANQTAPVLSRGEERELTSCAEAITKDSLAASLFSTGRPEASMFCEYGNFSVKGRADWLESDYLVDLKATTDASESGFSREILQRRYHVQAALYWKICAILNHPIRAFYFVAVERPDLRSGRLARVNVRELAPKAMELGLTELEKDLESLHRCEQLGIWPGYSGNVTTPAPIDLPRWAYKDEELQLVMSGHAVTL